MKIHKFRTVSCATGLGVHGLGLNKKMSLLLAVLTTLLKCINRFGAGITSTDLRPLALSKMNQYKLLKSMAACE